VDKLVQLWAGVRAHHLDIEKGRATVATLAYNVQATWAQPREQERMWVRSTAVR